MGTAEKIAVRYLRCRLAARAKNPERRRGTKFAGQPFGDEPPPAAWSEAYRAIDPAIDNIIDHMAANQIDGYTIILLGEARQPRDQPTSREMRKHADRQSAVNRSPLRNRECAIEQRNGLSHLRHEGEASRRGAHTLTVPDEQTHRETALKAPDLLAHGTMRKRQGVGRLGEAAMPHGRVQDQKALQGRNSMNHYDC
jgi:hypothetical protein